MINLDCNGNEIKIDARVKCYSGDSMYDGVVKTINGRVIGVEVENGVCAFFNDEVEVYAMSWTAVHEKEFQEMLAKRK
jgi:hypothetical protein